MSTAMTVEETFSYLTRQYGTLSIKQLSELPSLKDDIVSTGIMGLDIALGVGGIKKGSIVEIYAPESAGNLLLTNCVVIAETTAIKHGKCVFLQK